MLFAEGGYHHGLDRVHPVLRLVKDDAVRGLEHVLGHFDTVQPELLVHVAAGLCLQVVVGGEAVHELAVRIAGALHQFRIHLIRHQQADALLPDFGGLAHGNPDVGIDEVAALHAGIHVVRDGDAGSGLGGDRHALGHQFGGRLQGLRGDDAYIHPHLGAAHQQGVAHVETGITQIGKGYVLQGLVAVLGHREKVGEDLRGMEFVGEAVPHGDAGILGELFHGRLGESAVLDAVEHPSQHASRVLHRFLDADLGAGGTQVGHMRALVVGGHLEGATGAGGGLLEDEGDVLAGHRGTFGALPLGALEVAGEVQQVLDFRRGEVEQFEETAVFEFVCHVT